MTNEPTRRSGDSPFRTPLDLTKGVPGDVLEAFLDGLLTPEQSLAVGRALEQEEAAKSAVSLQKGIDRVLRDQFCGPVSIQLRDPVVSTSGAASTGPDVAGSLRFPADRARLRQPMWLKATLAAAAMLVMTVGTLWALGVVETGMLGVTPRGLTAPGPVYLSKVSHGFVPEWRCTNDDEFQALTMKVFKQPLLLAETPGIEVVGWSYYQAVLGPDTHQLLVRVNGTPVIVFIDLKKRARYLSAPTGSGLHVFKRELGELVMYEMTPSRAPQVLKRFYDPSQGGPPAACAESGK